MVDLQSPASSLQPRSSVPRRILIIRLDRMGDVILSTPVLQQLRAAYPEAFIAMLVSPACRELVEGNPHLNDVLLYDKTGEQRGLWSTIRFARRVRRLDFDTALILHPTRRSHWIARLAGIPRRLGYARKSGWLLTHRLPHRKQEGSRHEAEYALELLRLVGLEPAAPQSFVPVSSRAARRIDTLFHESHVENSASLIAIHPSASCVSKRWMPERFAQVADRLIEAELGRIVIVAGPEDVPHAQAMARAMRHAPLNVAGALSVGELAALLARCRLLISNDSGPVHVAAALGTPVVDLFGRNQRGLSPRRWGPLGTGHVVLHKEVGCVTCLAHACDIGFLCLTALSVEEVFQAAVSILQKHQQISDTRHATRDKDV